MKKLILFIILSLLPCGMATAAESGKLTMFAAATDIDKIMAAFTADTGIKVDYIEMSSGEVLTRTRAAKGKAQADIWYGGGLDRVHSSVVAPSPQ